MKSLLSILLFVSISGFSQADTSGFSGNVKVNAVSFLYNTKGNGNAVVYIPGKGNYSWCDTCLNQLNDSLNFCRNSAWAAGKGWLNTFTPTNTLGIPAFQNLQTTVNNITTTVAKVDSAAPYMRVSKNTALQLSTSWQTINFSPGATSQDVNSFGNDSITGKPLLWYDTTVTNRLFKFGSKGGANYLATLYLSFTTTLITTRSTIQYRFVIPNGVGTGVDYYFPFPNNGGYEDFSEATILANGTMNKKDVIPIYLSSPLRANGMYLQARLSNSLITFGTCTINGAALLIQQTK